MDWCPTYGPPFSLHQSSYFWPLGMVSPSRELEGCCVSISLLALSSLARLRSARLRSVSTRLAPHHPGGVQESVQKPWWRRVFGG